MPFNTRTGGQQDVAQQGYTELRVLKGERRGKFFKNPISRFIAVPAGAGTGRVDVFALVAFSKGVQSIQFLRNDLGRDPGSAKVVATFDLSNKAVAATLAKGTAVGNNYLKASDTTPSGGILFYWVRVIPLHTNFQPVLSGPIQVTAP